MIQASTQDNREQFSAVHRILNERGPDHYSVKAHNEQVERELSLLLKQRSLAQFCEDMAALRSRADVVIASHHWGLDHEVLDYQVEIARTAIDVGADLVMGHGPHMPLGIEIYKDKPIFYGVGSFSFETGHRGRTHPDWIGLMLHVAVEDAVLVRAAFSFVRHNARNETIPRAITEEQAEVDQLRRLSTRFGTTLQVEGDEVVVWRKP
jgi:poly-gamma-glutamate capsule biosynthesis protein CapA/YwtB (metallophosphatase superfamily)